MYAHHASPPRIPQPPHSAGLPYKGLRAAIDPLQIPSPVEVIEGDQEQWDGNTFLTLPGSHVPLSTTDFVAIDQGNSSPRFIRASTWNVPSTSRLVSECQIPLAVMIQPFADVDPREEPVPVVETGQLGPMRCGRCRGYINPWCTWILNGAKWKCNLCSHETEVPSEYYCALDANLLRLDHAQRPELNKGTVDFIVSEEYYSPHPPPRITPLFTPVVPPPPPAAGHRIPKPMDYVFIIEVTTEAIRSGFTRTAAESILRILYGDEGSGVLPCFPTTVSESGDSQSRNRIAIVTFDQSLHFYNFASHLDAAEMLVVSDTDDVFLPTVDGVFINPYESRPLIEKLLNSLIQRDDYGSLGDSALGAALVGGLAALAGEGGQVVAFASMFPNVGLGALKPREDEGALYDTDKETSLFRPRDDAWEDIAEQCSEAGVGINIFLGMYKPIDIGSIGVTASKTGGELFFYPRFDATRDAAVLESHLRRLISRTTVYNAAMRIRCSYGLRIAKTYGNYYENAAADLDFGTLDADKAICAEFEHSKNLDDRQNAFFQCAVLYTSVDGQRRVRVCNLALQVASLAGNVFRFADTDTVVCHMVREAVSKLPQQKIAHIQEELTEKCAAILLGYRRNCAAATVVSQLIIPEAFRALPVYTLAMMKSKPLKGRSVTSDVRNYAAHKLMGMSARATMHHLYPRLMALHDLDQFIALPDPNSGRIDIPALMRDSYIFMTGSGVYLIDNEEMMVMWIGTSVSPQILQDLFGVDDVLKVDRTMTELPRFDTLLSTQVNNILSHRFRQRGYSPKFMIARQNMDGAELEFSDMLVEDQNNAAMSYLDYLCLVHKQIGAALTSGGSLTSNTGFRGSPW
ncbi:hypothetical protein ABKN59_005186 [Abortiporus biennis]